MIYKNNFLKKVIFRIDFDKTELGKLKSFLEKFESKFPIVQERRGEEGFINFNVKTKELQQETSTLTVWDIYNKEKTIKILVRPTLLAIEYSVYKNSSTLISNIGLVSQFIKEFHIKTINRVGLRYINEIKLEEKGPLEWKKYINKELLSSIDFSTKTKIAPSRIMGSIVFREEFGSINFVYGIWNPSFPGAISEKAYILDFDAYSKFPLSTDDANLVDVVREYNSRIQDLFECAITEDFRKLANK